MPIAFEIDAGTRELIRYFVLPSDTDEDRAISAVDLQPGARAVVRSAAVFVDTAGAARALDDADPAPGFADPEDGAFPTAPPVAIWIPGQAPVRTEGMGYPLPSGSDIVLRVQYKKTWITEGQAFTDQSRVGLYFSDAGADAIDSMVVTSPATVSGREVTFSHDISADVTLLSLIPEVDIESSEIQVEAVKPDGSRIPMLWLREPDSGWTTRFWFDVPVSLPQGSRLDVRAILDPGAERQPANSLLGAAAAVPIRFAVDYIEGTTAAN